MSKELDSKIEIAKRFAKITRETIDVEGVKVQPDGTVIWPGGERPKEVVPVLERDILGTSVRQRLAVKTALELYVQTESAKGALEDPEHLIHTAQELLETLGEITEAKIPVIQEPPKKRGRKPKLTPPPALPGPELPPSALAEDFGDDEDQD